MLVRFYTPAGVMNTPSNMGYIHVGMCSPKEYGLCTSYLSVELGASLRGEGGGGGKLSFSLGCTASLFKSFRKCLKNNSYYTGPYGMQLILSDKLDYLRAICRLLSWVLL